MCFLFAVHIALRSFGEKGDHFVLCECQNNLKRQLPSVSKTAERKEVMTQEVSIYLSASHYTV